MNVLAACRGVSVVFGRGESEVAALAGVDFEVREGETVALLGRSGSGKTTLLHVLGGLVEPTSGVVERTSRASYVFQSANLLPHFTAIENVAFAARVSGNEADSQLGPEEVLALVGLSERLDQLPGELSGGEAQRVAIARALAQAPRLLLCDEPTGHLDSDTSARVLALLDELQRTFGFGLVVATHDPGVASRLEREVELHDGRVAMEPVEA
ncbi:MAG: ABC transporter ATP-binding protein [Gaiellaceae bacterium]